MRVPDRPTQAVDPARAGGAAAPGAPAMSEELKAVLRNMGAAGYRAGYEASLNRLHSDPYESARVHFPDGAGREIRFVLEQVHGDGYMRGMHDPSARLPRGGRLEGRGAGLAGVDSPRRAGAEDGAAGDRRRGLRPQLL